MGDTQREHGRGIVPAGYQALLGALKERIRAAQVRAALSVNRELITLYWQVGRDILAQQREHGWGARVIDRLAADLRHAFPTMTVFSRRNLHYMRAFAEAYPDEHFVQQVVAQIPWGHNVRLLDAVKDAEDRAWYRRPCSSVTAGRSSSPIRRVRIVPGLFSSRGSLAMPG